jgi:hypothetical protein
LLHENRQRDNEVLGLKNGIFVPLLHGLFRIVVVIVVESIFYLKVY